MPDRILRDELLTSERYWSVSIEAQRLFVHLILVVDDTGRFSGKNYTIRAACFPGHAIDPAKLEKLLQELVDVDLVRMYSAHDERFVFVPRSRQRLRYPRSKYPDPPQGINDIGSEKTDSSTSQDRLKSAEVKRSEVKRSKTKNTTASNEAMPDAFVNLKTCYPKRSGGDPTGRALKAYRARIKAGDTGQTMLDGVERYRAWCDADGRTGTKYVLQLATFLGPDRYYREPWTIEIQQPREKNEWWTSEDATQRMGQSIGLMPRAGESWNEFRARIKAKLQAMA